MKQIKKKNVVTQQNTRAFAAGLSALHTSCLLSINSVSRRQHGVGTA